MMTKGRVNLPRTVASVPIWSHLAGVTLVPIIYSNQQNAIADSWRLPILGDEIFANWGDLP